MGVGVGVRRKYTRREGGRKEGWEEGRMGEGMKGGREEGKEGRGMDETVGRK